ncbi:ATP-binding cassette domain-containing protein [Treponema sp.]|uniref:ATP-binding cassette domain-containing protein n=1 Tax=Treponema sp. TaxID=166 RepID=UPI003FA1C4B0
MEQLSLKDICVTYHSGASAFTALDNISFSLKKGESLAITGESGSGKSTIAKLLIGIEKPSSGTIYFDNENTAHWSYKNWKAHRKEIQAVFQDAAGTLNPALTVYQNLEEGLINLTPCTKSERKKVLLELCDMVRLKTSVLKTPVRQLSGGEQRRISLIRALAVHPDFLVADEVTGGLDTESAEAALTLLEDYARHYRLSCVFITHTLLHAQRIAQHSICLKQGCILNRYTRTVKNII